MSFLRTISDLFFGILMLAVLVVGARDVYRHMVITVAKEGSKKAKSA